MISIVYIGYVHNVRSYTSHVRIYIYTRDRIYIYTRDRNENDTDMYSYYRSIETYESK